MIYVILWGLVALIVIFFIGLFTHLVGRAYEWFKKQIKGEKL